jgi:hypothetical protein
MSAVAANNPAASAAVAAATAGAPASAVAVAPRRPRRVVTFVTGNANKLLETQQCFGDSITLKAQALDCQAKKQTGTAVTGGTSSAAGQKGPAHVG